MSIALLVKIASREWIVPVATEAAFKTYWAPGIAALGLQWLPLFETGSPIDVADVAEVLRELDALRQWLEQEGPLACDAIGSRVDLLVAELRRLQNEPAADIFVG